MNTIRLSMQQLDSKLVLDSLRTLDTQIDDNISTQRIVALLAVGFGLLATLLAAIGLYGVLAYSTAQRTREIGIRMALGAGGGNVLRLVLKEGMSLVAVGVAAGLLVAAGATRLLASFLFGVNPLDAITFLAIPVVLALVALLASYIPAHRAAKVDPMVALRYE